MKKFWNLMLAALVIFGAVACTENQVDNLQNPEKVVLSFVANIDIEGTRTDLEQNDGKWTTVWTGEDKLYVYGEDNVRYEFKNSKDNITLFECTDAGVENLRGANVTIDNGADFDSTKGTNGGSLYGTAVNFPYEQITLSVNNAFFRLSSVFVGTLVASEAVFYYGNEYHNSVELRPGEDVWVAFKPFTGTLNYSINGQVQKELSVAKDFAAKKIYPLGNVVTSELTKAEYGIVGGHQGWNTETPDAMYMIPGSNTSVKYDVEPSADGFKFYYNELIKVVNHPAVTTGEEGYLYFKPNSNWKQANARFAAYFFGNGTTWVNMVDTDGDGIYVVKEQPSKTYPNVIFCRMNPSASANNWDNKWNQTGDLTIPTNGNNLFTLAANAGWDGATTTWSKHTPTATDAYDEYIYEARWIGKDANNVITDWVTRWTNNQGSDNIVPATGKKYDIYFHKGDKQDWGYEVNYIVLESGSAQPALK